MPSSQTPPLGSTAIDPTSARPPIADAEIVRISPAELRATLGDFKAAGMSMLLDIGGVDYLTRVPRFDIVCHLLAMPLRAAGVSEVGTPRRVRVLVGVEADATHVPSIVDLWPNADWAEREIFDLFGITFDGHPDMRRIQMPDDWEGFPLRKDYAPRGPAAERSPRPSFANKSNVPAGTPPSGAVSEALQREIAHARQGIDG